MKNEMTIKQLLESIDEKLAWFHSDEFSLDEAKERFREIEGLARQVEVRLIAMRNEIEVLGQNFNE